MDLCQRWIIAEAWTHSASGHGKVHNAAQLYAFAATAVQGPENR